MSDAEKKERRGRPRTLDKEAVADVAMRAYWADGPDGVSLNAICKSAGVSKPSVYRDFGNDDGLAEAALARYAERVLSHVMLITESEDRFRQKLSRIMQLVAEDALHAQGCLYVKMRAARARTGPKTRALIDRIDAGTRDAFSRVLQEAREAGDWQGVISAELGARYLQEQFALALDMRARGENPKAVLEIALSVFDDAGDRSPPV